MIQLVKFTGAGIKLKCKQNILIIDKGIPEFIYLLYLLTL